MAKTKALVAAARSKTKKNKTKKAQRPGPRQIPFWGDLIEICTEADSTMSRAAAEFEGVNVVTITKDDDFSKKETQRFVKEYIQLKPGTSVHGSLPCTPWCARQSMNQAMLGPGFKKKLEKERKESKAMLKAFIEVAELAISLGGSASFELSLIHI